MDWMKSNKLKLNPDKTEVLWIRKPSIWDCSVLPVLNEVTLPLTEQVHSLGVLWDPFLTFENWISLVARRAFGQLQLIRQLRPFLNKNDLATVIHALVTSQLDNCKALYAGLPLKSLRKLQLV